MALVAPVWPEVSCGVIGSGSGWARRHNSLDRESKQNLVLVAVEFVFLFKMTMHGVKKVIQKRAYISKCRSDKERMAFWGCIKQFLLLPPLLAVYSFPIPTVSSV